MNSALIVFMKAARKGYVKTRLAESIGDELALEVYRNLIDRTMNAVRESESICRAFIYIDDETYRLQVSETIGVPAGELQIQSSGDLGEKMSHAFSDILEGRSFDRAVIIGTDLADINVSIIKEALDCLDASDLVIGPAFDGGYYLLGLKELHKNLFQNINWSTSSVLRQTIAHAKKKGINFSLLEEKRDIDTLEDLGHADLGSYTGIQ